MKRWAHFEWGMYLSVALIALAVPITTTMMGMSDRAIYVNDASIWWPVKDETVPFLPCALFVTLCVIAPFVFEILVVQMAVVSQSQIGPRDKKEYQDMDESEKEEAAGHEPLSGVMSAVRLFLAGVCATVFCLSLCLLFKYYIAWPRPDEIHRCFGPDFVTPPELYNNGVITDPASQCQSSEVAPKVSRQSFPSGHSASSLCSSLFLTMYLVWRSYLFAKGRGAWFRVLGHFLHFLALIVLFTGISIGVSRIYDNRHHPWDVVAGWAIGSISFSAICIPTAFAIHDDYFARLVVLPS